MATSGYRGRFAPSPTGPLHFGSLLAALASYLDARHHDGIWLLRIEDIDPPREVPGASHAILNSLQHHGLRWDGDVIYQSTRSAYYDAALDALRALGLLFPCSCTRAVLGPGGSCGRRCTPGPNDLTSLRIGVEGHDHFDDFIRGTTRAEPPGDLVLKRKDSLYAYALAVVVDDAAQGITHVLRGDDLRQQSTPQIRLHELLGSQPPAFGHIPLLVGWDGSKLSKQTGAAALEDAQAVENLRLALRYLGQQEQQHSTVTGILDAAVSAWSRAALGAAAGQSFRYPPSQTP